MMLTVKELSDWLKIKPSTLYLWATQGKIPCRRIHSLIRFEQEAIQRWLESFPKLHLRSLPKLLNISAAPDLDALIAAAKREAYTPPHGETKPISSLIEKEDVDGAI
jgi:excisionase family DNA binding protein